MRTIVHLSDLHFGRTDPALLAPLATLVRKLEPHLVVISGDLTQRARSNQFQEARRFLDELPSPQIVVPGNHDVPLYNLFSRFFTPLTKYRRYITDDLDPVFIDEEIAVVGINTARSLTIKDGRINKEQIANARKVLCPAAHHLVKIIVTHHPFDLPDNQDNDDLVGRAPLAMAAFAECGADMLLAGHLHTSHTESTAERYKIGDYSAIVVQAGTATSTRGRGESNSFNVLRVDNGVIAIERYSWIPEKNEFEHSGSVSFERLANTWTRVKG
ncbi:MAG: metallophosphoesterase family protein [Pseudomonadota bacterium]